MEASSKRSLLFILASLSALTILATDLYLPVLPQLGADIGAGPTAVAATISALLAGIVLGQLLAGPLSDAYGRKGPILLGCLVFTVAQVLCALAPTIGVLLVVRFLAGIAAAACMAVPNAVVMDAFPGERAARGYATLAAVTALVPVAAPILGGQLAKVMSWRGMFLVLAVLSLIVLVTTALALPETLPADRRRPAHLLSFLRDLGGVVRVRTFLGWALAVAAVSGVLFAYIGASSFVLEDNFGLSPQQFSLVFAGNAVGIFLTSTLTRQLAHRVGGPSLVAAGQIAIAVGAVVLAAGIGSHVLALVVVGLFLAVASLGLVMPSGTGLAMRAVPGRSGSAAGVMGMLGFTVGGIASPVASLGGSPWSMVAVIGVCAVAGPLCRVLLTRAA